MPAANLHDARRPDFAGLHFERRVLGSMAFGALVARADSKTVARGCVLVSSAVLIFALTMIYGLIKPIFSLTGWSGIPFTLLPGLFSLGLFLIARFASARVARSS
jgi:hypothetical protein